MDYGSVLVLTDSVHVKDWLVVPVNIVCMSVVVYLRP